MIYTAPCVMLLMRAASITRASGRGLGPGNDIEPTGEWHLGPIKVELAYPFLPWRLPLGAMEAYHGASMGELPMLQSSGMRLEVSMEISLQD